MILDISTTAALGKGAYEPLQLGWWRMLNQLRFSTFFFAEGQGYLGSYYRNCLQMGFELPPDTAIFIEYIYIYIWANYNNSHTWNKAILGWFPLLTMIPGLGRSEVVIIHPDIYIYVQLWLWLWAKTPDLCTKKKLVVIRMFISAFVWNHRFWRSWSWLYTVPSGKRLHNYGKSPCY